MDRVRNWGNKKAMSKVAGPLKRERGQSQNRGQTEKKMKLAGSSEEGEMDGLARQVILFHGQVMGSMFLF